MDGYKNIINENNLGKLKQILNTYDYFNTYMVFHSGEDKRTLDNVRKFLSNRFNVPLECLNNNLFVTIYSEEISGIVCDFNLNGEDVTSKVCQLLKDYNYPIKYFPVYNQDVGDWTEKDYDNFDIAYCKYLFD